MDDVSDQAPTGTRSVNEPAKPFRALSSHELVVGYPDDLSPENSGVTNMLEIVKLLQAEDIPCFMMDVPPLQYYGAPRSRSQFVVCVPTEQHHRACETIQRQSDTIEPCKASVLGYRNEVPNIYPRFKFRGLRLFFVVVPSIAYHIDCTPDHIEHSESGMPYPTLAEFAQSLIETYNIVDLTDLIDGMNLTNEWGEENLNLKSGYDEEWWAWKNEQLEEHTPPGRLSLTKVAEKFIPKDVLWRDTCSDERKRKRQGIKYNERKATRFRCDGKKDPREKKGRRGI